MKNDGFFFGELGLNKHFLPVSHISGKISVHDLAIIAGYGKYFTKKELSIVDINGTKTEVNAIFNGKCVFIEDSEPIVQIYIP